MGASPPPETVRVAPPPQPSRVAPVPAIPTPRSSPRVNPVEVATAQAEPAVQQVESEPAPREDSEDYPVPQPTRRVTRTRRPEAQIGKRRKPLPLLLGIAGGVVFVAVGFLVYFYLFANPSDSSNDPKPQRVTHRVVAGSTGSLKQVLRKAKDGDLIILEGDVIDADVNITVPNLTIEAEPGRQVTWTCHPRAAPGAKMLLVSNVPGLQLRGIMLDGVNKAETLISIYGHCPGTHLDKLQLKNATKYGVVFVNCEGTADSPVRLTDVTITTTKPTESAIRFDLAKGA